MARKDHVMQVGNSAARLFPHQFQRIEAADKKLFTVLAEKTRGGIKAGPNGKPLMCTLELASTEQKSWLSFNRNL